MLVPTYQDGYDISQVIQSTLDPSRAYMAFLTWPLLLFTPSSSAPTSIHICAQGAQTIVTYQEILEAYPGPSFKNILKQCKKVQSLPNLREKCT